MSYCIQSVYELAHMRLDIHLEQWMPPQKEEMPWLSVCYEPNSGVVLSHSLSISLPNQKTGALLLYEAFSSSENQPLGGVPYAIRVDTPHELALQTQHVLGLMDVAVHLPTSHRNIDCRVERFFSLIQTHFAAIGTGSHDVSSASAELTLETLQALFEAFLHEYHSTVLDHAGHTRLSFWQECVPRCPVEPTLLARLVQQIDRRRVTKQGISYQGRTYWHPFLASLLGKIVDIRVDMKEVMPPEIEVISHNQHLCIAQVTC